VAVGAVCGERLSETTPLRVKKQGISRIFGDFQGRDAPKAPQSQPLSEQIPVNANREFFDGQQGSSAL
jgi:hypothetical protein